MRVLGQHTPRGIFLVDDFVGEDEEASLVGVADGVLGKRKYEGRHWDSVIQGFRECERTVGELCRDLDARAEGYLRAVADRVAVQVEQVDPLATLREQIHVLDLHAKGVMDAHVDSEWAFGGCLASVALLSDCVVRLRNRECPGAEVVDILVPRRSLYILSSDARYGWTHEITDTSGGEAAAARVPSILLAETEEEEDAADFASVPVGQLPAVRQQFGEQQVERTRRVSFLFRSQASSAAAAVGERER